MVMQSATNVKLSLKPSNYGTNRCQRDSFNCFNQFYMN